MAAAVVTLELCRNSRNWTKIVEGMVKMETKIFRKHKSLAKSFDDELKKKNSGLLYIQTTGDKVVGYIVYS
ncbi:hypothetical protein LINPERHAP2_LOCUS39421 [Linum perenne]